MSKRWGKIGPLQERFDEMRDAAPTTTRCAFCPWTFNGTAAEGRTASLDHRRHAHPDCVVYVRPRRTKRVEQTAADRAIVQTLAEHRPTVKRMSRTKLTDQRIADAAQRYDTGESVRAIAADHYNDWGYRSIETLAVALYRALPEKVERWRGREQRTTRSNATRMTPRRIDAIETLYRAKWSISQIAVLIHERWGFASVAACRTELSRCLKDRDIELRRHGTVTDLPEMGRHAAAALIARADGESDREPVFSGSRETEHRYRQRLMEAS